MPQPLISIDLDDVFLEGCDFKIDISQQQEHLKITLDGGYQGSENIVYFELNFKHVACFYYENNEMWTEALEQKYDLSTIIENGYRGIFRCDQSDLDKIKDYDPLNRLDLTRFLIIGQHCFCEFIAQKQFAIHETYSRDE